MPTEITLTLSNNQELKIRRLTLRGWAKLESVKRALDEAVSKKDFVLYSVALGQFIETASSIPIEWDKLPWWDLVETYVKVVDLNTPTIKFPILDVSIKEKEDKLPWEYPDRSWYFWLNLFAKNYGWNEEQIGNLDIDTAIGLYQETQIDEQLQREWEWGMSEIAYPFNKNTNKSEFKPLNRPEWMLPVAPKQLPIIKMRKDMLPMGNIVDLSKELKRGI